VTTLDIGSICYRHYEFKFVTRLIKLLATKPSPGFIACSSIGHGPARSIVATQFLRKSIADVLLFIDGDTVFEPSDALRIAQNAKDCNAVIGGIYPVRSADNSFPAAMFKENATVTFFAPEGSSFTEVEYVSGGFMAIPRTVLQTLVREMPLLHPGTQIEQWPLFRASDRDGYHYGEDWSFCDLARNAGFPILADTAIRLGHIGEYVHTLGDMIRPAPYTGPLEITRDGDQYLAAIPRREFLVE
jgi:hypothetical protein